MNRRTLFLSLAAVSGLAAQTVSQRLTAAIPFPFDCPGTAMAAGRYEVTRAGLASTLILRNLTTGQTIQVFAASTSQTRDTVNGLVFEKASDTYAFRAMVDAGTAHACNVAPSRKQLEQARNRPAERVYIAAR